MNVQTETIITRIAFTHFQRMICDIHIYIVYMKYKYPVVDCEGG